MRKKIDRTNWVRKFIDGKKKISSHSPVQTKFNRASCMCLAKIYQRSSEETENKKLTRRSPRKVKFMSGYGNPMKIDTGCEGSKIFTVTGTQKYEGRNFWQAKNFHDG